MRGSWKPGAEPSISGNYCKTTTLLSWGQHSAGDSARPFAASVGPGGQHPGPARPPRARAAVLGSGPRRTVHRDGRPCRLQGRTSGWPEPSAVPQTLGRAPLRPDVPSRRGLWHQHVLQPRQGLAQEEVEPSPRTREDAGRLHRLVGGPERTSDAGRPWCHRRGTEAREAAPQDAKARGRTRSQACRLPAL